MNQKMKRRSAGQKEMQINKSRTQSRSPSWHEKMTSIHAGEDKHPRPFRNKKKKRGVKFTEKSTRYFLFWFWGVLHNMGSSRLGDRMKRSKHRKTFLQGQHRATKGEKKRDLHR